AAQANLSNPNPPTDALIPLSPFDTITYQIHFGHFGFLYNYGPTNPSNEVTEQGLCRLLAEYREFAGRLIFNGNGRQCILLNDKGIRLVEGISCSPLGTLMDKPSPYYLDLHPHITGIEEVLFQVQLTRFACGSLVVGCTVHHAVVDALSLSHFLIAWAQTVRDGIPVLPSHCMTAPCSSLATLLTFSLNIVRLSIQPINEWATTDYCDGNGTLLF
ncbi:Agmatine coumaroyltransferase-2, partial [Nymphaea thermarum]